MPAEAATTALSIPTIVWSGIVASFISLGGVILANRSSLERLKEQFRHDASEKHRDRISQLRRDVYLELTTQMTYALGHLGSLAERDPTNGELAGPLQSAMAQLARAQLVGTRETAALAAELSTLCGEALFNLIAAAKPMHELKIDIKICSNMYDQEYAQAKRVIAEMTQLNESGAPDQVKMAALQRSFENYQTNYTRYSDERNTAWSSYNHIQRGFIQAIFQELERISPIQIKLICAIRTEVGLDTDASELFHRLKLNQARMAKATENLLTHLDAD